MRYAIVKDGKVINVVATSDDVQRPDWIPSDTAKKGDLWDGNTFSDSQERFEREKRDAISRLTGLREKKEEEGFTYNGNVFPSDMRSVVRFQVADTAVQGGNPNDTTTFYNKAGQAVPMTPAQIRGALQALATKGVAISANYHARLAILEAVTTFEELNSFDEMVGWPT